MVNYIRAKRVYQIDHPFYEEGNVNRELWAKHIAFDFDIEEVLTDSEPQFYCNIYGCPSSFKTNFEFENHYNSVHKHVCATCKRVFPSNRLVEIHVLETHDALFKVMSERKKMYDCLVEGCSRKFWNNHVRKLHLVDLHKYPKDYNFHFKNKRDQKKAANNQKAKEPLASEDCGLDIVMMDLDKISVSAKDNYTKSVDSDNLANLTPKSKSKKYKSFKPKHTNTKPTHSNHSSNSDNINTTNTPVPALNPASNTNSLVDSNTSSTSTNPNFNSNSKHNLSTEPPDTNSNNDPSNTSTDSDQPQSKFKYSYSLKTKDFSFGHRSKRGGRR